METQTKQKLKKTLVRFGLVGLLTLGVGCGPKYRHYDFNGWIDGEQVQFTREDCRNELIVKAHDSEVRYTDMLCDGKIDYVQVSSQGSSQLYSEDLVGREILRKAQENYTNYLAKILAEKRAIGEKVILGGRK
jgi:hypothetical protein